MSTHDYIGRRIALWRDMAGMTQGQLAEAVGRSRKWVSELENGHIALTNRADLQNCAAVLGVSTTELTGQPALPKSTDEKAVFRLIPGLRASLDDDPDSPRDLTPDALAARLDEVMAARMACNYPVLAEKLPGVLLDARMLAARSRVGKAMLVKAAVCGSLTIKPLGYPDLAYRLAERADLVASDLEEPAARGAARFALSQSSLAGGTLGSRRRSFAIAAAAADELGDGDVDGDDLRTWYLMLSLQAGMAAAALGHTDDATARHTAAEATAQRIGADPWRMEPTEANIGVWRVNTALEGGDPGQAPVLARRVNRGELRSPQRRAHLHIGAGRGAYQDGNPAEAVRHFSEAFLAAPGEVRTRVTVRELVGAMVRESRGRGSEELRDLAVNVGIDPLDPDSAGIA